MALASLSAASVVSAELRRICMPRRGRQLPEQMQAGRGVRFDYLIAYLPPGQMLPSPLVLYMDSPPLTLLYSVLCAGIMALAATMSAASERRVPMLVKLWPGVS